MKSGRNLILLALIVLASLIVIALVPEKSSMILNTSFDYFLQMVVIFPAILVLMGLFSVWISDEFILNQLGDKSGLKGIAISFVLGAIPTGPLFVAFPIAQTLKNKGASTKNIVIFLSAWACIKIPQELVELQFLGLKFMLARLSLSIIFITLMGFILDKILKQNK
jgi:uncharacterized membrane protein YraQ (UPF0718 family)